MLDKKLMHCREDDPRRCNAVAKGRQCCYLSVEGGSVCMLHGGSMVIERIERESLNMYRLGKYQKRVNEFAKSTGLRTVDEEIGILRMMLEEVVAKCDSSIDLLLYSSKISDLVRDIRACVITADKLATKTGMLMGRGEALTVAQKVIDIISSNITDEAVMLRIADQIGEAFLTPIESQLKLA